MSAYGAIRKQMVEQREEQAHSLGCAAHDCPCVGAISDGGGKFFCSYHHRSASEKWPSITSALNEHKWLLDFSAEIRRMHRMAQDWREFARRFWDQSPEDGPLPREEYAMYDTRMRSELAYRCGLQKKPIAKEIAPVTAKRGNVVDHFGAQA